MVKVYTFNDGRIIEVADQYDCTPRPDFWVEHQYEGTFSDVFASLPVDESGQKIMMWPVDPTRVPVIQPVSETVVASTEPAPELSFEDWRQLRVDQVSAAVCRLLAKADWVEIRQADPDETTKMTDEEFKAFRAGRREIRQMFEDYKAKMLTLTTKEEVTVYQNTALFEIQAKVLDV